MDISWFLGMALLALVQIVYHWVSDSESFPVEGSLFIVDPKTVPKLGREDLRP